MSQDDHPVDTTNSRARVTNYESTEAVVKQENTTDQELRTLKQNYEELMREHKCMYDIFMNDLEFRNRLRSTNYPQHDNSMHNYGPQANIGAFHDNYNSSSTGNAYSNMNFRFGNSSNQMREMYQYNQQYLLNQMNYAPYQSNTQSTNQQVSPVGQNVNPSAAGELPRVTEARNDSRDRSTEHSTSRNRRTESRSRRPKRDPQNFLTKVEFNKIPPVPVANIAVLGFILILLTILEMIFDEKLCTILFRSIGVFLLLSFVNKDPIAEPICNCSTKDKDILKKINDLTNAIEPKEIDDTEESLLPILPVLNTGPEDTTVIDTKEEKSISLAMKPRPMRTASFFIDSGSNYHIVNDKTLLDEFVQPCPNYTMGKVKGMSKKQPGEKVMGYGTIEPLGKVIYAPEVAYNFISVNQLTKSGFQVIFIGDECTAERIVEGAIITIKARKSSEEQYIAELSVREINSKVVTRTMTLAEARDFAINGLCCMLTITRSPSTCDALPVSQRPEILTDPVSSSNELIIDSGCSEHMFNTCRPLTNYSKLNLFDKTVTVANGSVVPVEGIGRCGILKHVYFVPLLSHSLLSVNSLTNEGIDVLFRDDYVIISRGKSGLKFDSMRARKNRGLYRISLIQFELCNMIPHVFCLAHAAIGDEAIECNLISENARNDAISLVHYAFGHPSAQRTRHICKCLNIPSIRKLEPKGFEFLRNCEFCRQAKGKRNSFTGTVARSQPLGKQWYADVKGPFEKPSLIHGNVYVFGIIEARTRYLIQFYIKKKSDVETCIRSWYEHYIKGLRETSKNDDLNHIFLNTDMGESTSHKIIDYLSGVGIILSTTCPHTPEQNMVIERVWRTIGESAIAMLLTANLSEIYWEEARKTACYLYNRSPCAHEEMHPDSPYQRFYGVAPHVSHLKIFGTTCYPTNLVKNKGNHEPKAWTGIFVGYQDQQLVGWRIYLPKSNEFIITAHASFEDHRVRMPGSASDSKSNSEILSTSSRYTPKELSSVEVGLSTSFKVPPVEDGKKLRTKQVLGKMY